MTGDCVGCGRKGVRVVRVAIGHGHSLLCGECFRRWLWMHEVLS